MQVFLSWSGDRSYAVAAALRTWLPRVLQSIKPWMSSTDIAAGSRWLAEVSGKLDTTSIGIICVTPENLTSPWLHFEAGALSKVLDHSRVCPVAFDLTPGQISGPLSQFQAVTLNQVGIRQVLLTINMVLGDKALPENDLDEILSVWWAKLEARLFAIPATTAPRHARQVDDQLEELLQLSREQLRRENLRLEAAQAKDSRIDLLLDTLERGLTSMQQLPTKLNRDLSVLKDSIGSLPQLNLANKELLTDSIGALLTRFSMPTITDSDAQAMVELTTTLRQIQEEGKRRTQDILSPPT